MPKYLLKLVIVVIVLIIFFRPAGFINTKGDGKITIDFNNAEIFAVICEKMSENDYSERKIDLPTDIIEVIKTLEPIRYVESMGLGNYYKIALDDGENRFEVMFYIGESGIDKTAAVKKLDENRNVEWVWENKITNMDKINEIFS